MTATLSDSQLTPFETALREEERWIANVCDKPIPTDPRAGHRAYLGPTAIDLTPIADAAERAARAMETQRKIQKREAALFRSWKSADFSTYSHQTKRPAPFSTGRAC